MTARILTRTAIPVSIFCGLILWAHSGAVAIPVSSIVAFGPTYGYDTNGHTLGLELRGGKTSIVSLFGVVDQHWHFGNSEYGGLFGGEFFFAFVGAGMYVHYTVSDRGLVPGFGYRILGLLPTPGLVVLMPYFGRRDMVDRPAQNRFGISMQFGF